MRNFQIKGLAFQVPYKLQEVEKSMNLLEREYPECKTIKEMDEKIQKEEFDN